MSTVNLKKGIILAAWLGAGLFVGVNLLLGVLYQDRIYPGVFVGGNNVGNMTRRQATEVLQHQTSAFHIVMSVDGQHYSVKPAAVGANYDIATTVNEAFAVGHSYALPLVGMLSSQHPAPLAYAYSVDRNELKAFVATMATSQAQAPVDASVVVDKGVAKVLPDKSGLGVSKTMLENAIIGGLGTQVDRLKVTRSQISADVRVPQAQVAADQATKLVATHMMLTYQDKHFTPTASQIGSWLTFSKADSGNLSVAVNQAKVIEYINSFAGQIEIAAIPKKVTAVNGVVKDVQDGVNGLAIDKGVLAKQIGDNLLKGPQAALSVPTVAVAFKTVYNNTISLDVAQYIEVNLSTQHLWAYQDHQIAFESPVTSGAAGAGFPTVQGLFSIYSKERNRYLDGRPLGYNYNVFVQYWMPFYADYGLHDASWRSTYGGSDYYYNGSHGCVNLPLATAAWIFNWASIGTPVWVHS